MLEMGEALFTNSSYSTLTLDKARARENLEKFVIEGGTEYLCLLSLAEEKPVGIIAAYAFTPLFSTQKVAVEVLWYLQEEHRKSRRGREMMEAYEYWAKMGGCKTVQYGFLESSPKGMVKMYERYGCVKTETVYSKVIA
jgi:GNAT superfamily N-acetyltransferase